MGITNRLTGEYRVVPVSGAQSFRDYWIPASAALGLQLVCHLHDGTFTSVPADQIPLIVDELKQLRGYAAARPNFEFIIERIDMILVAFETTDPGDHDYDFG